MIITAIVVAFSATAVAVALLLQLFKNSGTATLDGEDTQSRKIDGA
jgi:multisubunit Na+/H+ antiporter MnhC subunit